MINVLELDDPFGIELLGHTPPLTHVSCCRFVNALGREKFVFVRMLITALFKIRAALRASSSRYPESALSFLPKKKTEDLGIISCGCPV